MAWNDLTNPEAWKLALANLLRKGEDVGTYISEAPEKAGKAIVEAGQRQSALMNKAFDPTGKTLIRDPQAANQAAMNLLEGPLSIAPVGMTRVDALKQAFDKAESIKPSFLGNDLYEQGVKQVEFDDGNAYARFLTDNKGNLRLLTLETENSPNVRGREILQWLKDTYKKPIKVNEVDPPAAKYWDKMQKEGLIQDWSHGIYEGKIIE